MDIATSAGLALGTLADLALADPRRRHPVAGFGQAATALERRVWRDSRAAGAGYTATCVGTTAALGWAAARATRRSPAARTVLTAAATWTVLGGTSLGRAATVMHDHLAAGDLPAARGQLPSLAGRDPRGLAEAELVRATVESVAENTSDAAVAPLFWGAVAGVPGLLAYRAVNTLDAMVGHRSARYARFGWASARLDDVANWVPARLTAALTVLCAPLVGGSAAGALRAWRRDGARHPSPNAGRCEAALAGALGLRLGGRNAYGTRVEDRPPLGDGEPPVRADVVRSVRLSRAVWCVAAVAAVSSRSVLGDRWSGHPRAIGLRGRRSRPGASRAGSG
ncbi:cobalamin biosynthesis protein [Modestobacter sp. I12A-02628]|uniref:Cobalamin biosynthesis protein CobD n=1 Tax=Goekera deserti TaxID=2497753 RepID=A0A7K3WEG5_9ACTN|nr:cobalamin biosynthesis protein [Goekera deserti]MPQ98086.1 cobalamin biosynthesis protein [Goekera deserti]NDI48733.1 cobalamin biosynthesis protein [Goekera deserti]NEL54888.1 cobalamin biosynthesis protein [Goekera deserti]